MTDDESTKESLDEFVAGSRVVQSIEAAASSRTSSVMFGLGQRLGTGWKRSVLYRWLTAEPNARRIVVDLRDTWTVGPVLAFLDRAEAFLVAGYTQSRLGGLVDTLRHSGESGSPSTRHRDEHDPSDRSEGED